MFYMQHKGRKKAAKVVEFMPVDGIVDPTNQQETFRKEMKNHKCSTISDTYSPDALRQNTPLMKTVAGWPKAA